MELRDNLRDIYSKHSAKAPFQVFNMDLGNFKAPKKAG